MLAVHLYHSHARRLAPAVCWFVVAGLVSPAIEISAPLLEREALVMTLALVEHGNSEVEGTLVVAHTVGLAAESAPAAVDSQLPPTDGRTNRAQVALVDPVVVPQGMPGAVDEDDLPREEPEKQRAPRLSPIPPTGLLRAPTALVDLPSLQPLLQPRSHSLLPQGPVQLPLPPHFGYAVVVPRSVQPTVFAADDEGFVPAEDDLTPLVPMGTLVHLGSQVAGTSPSAGRLQPVWQRHLLESLLQEAGEGFRS